MGGSPLRIGESAMVHAVGSYIGPNWNLSQDAPDVLIDRRFSTGGGVRLDVDRDGAGPALMGIESHTGVGPQEKVAEGPSR